MRLKRWVLDRLLVKPNKPVRPPARVPFSWARLVRRAVPSWVRHRPKDL